MIRFFLSFLFCSLSAGLFAQIKTPAPSPSTIVTQTVGLSKVTLEYSRPSVKNRKIFGDLVPYNKVWRTGANKITTISFDQDVMVNGQKIAAGTYGFCSIPGQKEWTLIFNSDNKQWGTYGYDASKDVLRLTAKAEKLPAKQEYFTIAFDGFTATSSDIVISWEKTAVRFKVEHDTKSQILAEIARKTAEPDATTDTYFDAANYYLDNNMDINKALEWVNKVVEKDKQYWTYSLRARILAKLGQCDKARADANLSMEMAKKDNDPAYVKIAQKVLDQCAK